MQHSEPERVTAELLDELRRIMPFDPEHLPREIELTEQFLGIVIDDPANIRHAGRISTDRGSSVTVRVIRTDEEAVIAASTTRLLESGPT